MATRDTPPANETPPAAETPSASDERVRAVGLIRRLLGRPEFGAVIAAVIVYMLFVVLAVVRDTNFVSFDTLITILNRGAPLGILAVGVAMLMIGGEFDLSIGSIWGFTGMAMAIAISPTEAGGWGWPVWAALVFSLILALAVGAFNGILVVKTGLPSFIVTLGSLFIFRGLTTALTRQWTGRTQLGSLDDASGFDVLEPFLAGNFWGRLTVDILWWVGLAALATWILLRTKVGNWIFGAGGDANASRNVGVPVARVKVGLFMTTASAAWLVAVLTNMRFLSADTLRGNLQEFNAIIAVVIGGTLLTGGYGSAIGAMFGAFIFAMVQQGIVISKFDGDWFKVIVGVVIVVAVVANNYIRNKAAKA